MSGNLATAVSHETGLSFSIDSDQEKSWIRADRYLEKGIRQSSSIRRL